MLASATPRDLRIDSFFSLSNSGEKEKLIESAVPKTILVSGGFLRKPLTLNIILDDTGHYLAYHPIILTHGYGNNEREAADDFLHMLLGLYSELSGEEGKLALHLRRDLEYIRDYVGDII